MEQATWETFLKFYQKKKNSALLKNGLSVRIYLLLLTLQENMAPDCSWNYRKITW